MKFIILIFILFISCDSDNNSEEQSIESYIISNQRDYNTDDCSGDFTMEWKCDSIENMDFVSQLLCEEQCNEACHAENEGMVVFYNNQIFDLEFDWDDVCQIDEDCGETEYEDGALKEYPQCFQNLCHEWQILSHNSYRANSYLDCFSNDNLEIRCFVINGNYLYVYNQQENCKSFEISSHNYNITCTSNGEMCFLE